MKIALIANYSLIGGTRTYVKQLVSLYSKAGFRCLLIGAGPAGDSDMASYCASYGTEYVSTYYSLGGRYSWLLRVFFLDRKIQQLISVYKPDMLVASVGDPGLFLPYMKYAKNSIYILHTSPEPHPGLIKRLIFRLIMRLATSPRCKYVAVSSYEARMMTEAWGLNRDLAPIIVYNTAGQSIESISKPVASPLKCLTVGHVVSYKNPLFWIEMAEAALRKSPNLRFTWVGPGPMLEECRLLVKQKCLQGRVEFVGGTPDPSTYYASSHVYIQPSLVESLGISVLDAMRHCMPCIVSNRGGLPELVEDGVSGFVVELESGASVFAQKVCHLSESMASIMLMGQAATSRYDKLFSQVLWEQKILALHA